jgi:hypothetical protein
VTRGASGIDWPTTIIASFAFMAHFIAIGAMYSDWLDPIIDEQVSLAGLVETLDQLPPPPPPEEQPKDEAKDKDKPEDKKEAQPAAKPQPSAKADAPAPGKKLSEAQAASLRNDLDEMMRGITLGAKGSGPATEGVITAGDVPTSALDGAAASAAGVGAGSDLKLGGGGGAIRPGAGGSGLSSLGNTSRGTTGAGDVAAVAGPKGSASVTSSMAMGTIDNASSVVAGMKAGFRRCYQKALDKNPDIAGSIRLKIRVGAGGEVAGVSSSETGNLPGDVVACVKARAQAASFSPPKGGSAVVDVPVTFVKQ